MENNTHDNNLFKGQISEKTYFEIFGLPSFNVLFYSSILILISAITIIFIIPGPSARAESLKILVLILGAIIIFIFILLKILWKKNFIRNTLYKSDIFGKFSEDEIEWNLGDFIRIIIPWTNFEKYIMRKKGIVLFYDFDQKILFHKSFFKDKDEWSKIRQLVKGKVSKAGIISG